MASRPAVKLNGVQLPPAMIAAEAQHHPAKTPAAAYQAAARALVIRTLLLEEANRQNVEAEPELVSPGKRETVDEARIRTLIEDRVPAIEPDEAQCRQFYDAAPSRFRSPDLFEASHILFIAHPHDVKAYEAAVSSAEGIIAELVRSPKRFEDLARERSECDSRANGGRLGQIVLGETVPEFEAVLNELQEGQFSTKPVKSRFGVHVLRLDARAVGNPLPFDYVQERIALFLAEKSWRRAVAGYIDRLIAQASIEGIDLTASVSREAAAA